MCVRLNMESQTSREKTATKMATPMETMWLPMNIVSYRHCESEGGEFEFHYTPQATNMQFTEMSFH